MKVKEVYKFQLGGPMPAGEAPVDQNQAPAPENAGGQEEAIMQVAQLLVDMLMQQVGDPRAVMAILEAAMQLASQTAQQATPLFLRLGGKIVRIK